MQELPDRRSLGLPDEPFSAYCKVCWQNVYCLWIDKAPHGGVCMFGHRKMSDCKQATDWAQMVGRIKSYTKKASGEINAAE